MFGELGTDEETTRVAFIAGEYFREALPESAPDDVRSAFYDRIEAARARERKQIERLGNRLADGEAIRVVDIMGDECRSMTRTSPGTLEGWGMKWGSLSRDLGGYRERFMPGSFTRSLADREGEMDVVALVDHDASKLLGRVSSQTMRVSENKDGLRYEVDMPNTTLGHDTAEQVRRGDVRGASVRFRGADDHWATIGGERIRTIRRATLREISATAFAAYPDATIAMQSQMRRLESFLANERQWLASQPVNRSLDEQYRRLMLS